MIVSRNWLNDYVSMDVDHDELVDRLTMSGLNHEATETVGDDLAIDLEVTSNRPDCLGHIGIAREIATLFERELTLPSNTYEVASETVADVCGVEIQAPDLCPRYTARLVRGVKIGPSPQWLVDRLATIGVASVNNVVDVTNYVMFECGQPLHAFDFAKLQGGRIIVRQPLADETIEAIDHHTYKLEPGMCVIADASRAVAIGGVMGGAQTEVGDQTTDVLIEAASFNPLSIRNTARKLNLHSPSSFRFERTIDPAMVDWASRRCCQLIQQIAGGEILDGVVDEGAMPPAPQPITMRFEQVTRILGISVPHDFAASTLQRLGLQIDDADERQITATPPTWRADLTREIDLIEEVGRIYGFDKIPDDAIVPMAASHKTDFDRVRDKVERVMTGAGFDEAITASFVPEPWSEAFSPWTDQPALRATQPMLGVLEKSSQNIGAVDCIRRSLVPSLLEARRINEYRSNVDIELFEIAKAYLPSDQPIPDQPTLLGLVSGRDFYAAKGILTGLLNVLNPDLKWDLAEWRDELLDPNLCGELKIDGQSIGYIGAVSKSGKKKFGLRTNAVVAEINLTRLAPLAVLTPIHHDPSPFPSVSRDFNFILDESVRWADLESCVRSAGSDLLEQIQYRETFRDPDRDGEGKKRVLLTATFRSPDSTLTGEQVDELSRAIVDACHAKLGANLVG